MNQSTQIFSFDISQPTRPRAIPISCTYLMKIPGLRILGLGTKGFEVRERVSTAIAHAGHRLPRKRAVLDFGSTASLPYDSVDLPAALALLWTQNQRTTKAMAAGGLALDGSVLPSGRPCRAVFAAWEAHCDSIILHPKDADQAIDFVKRIRTLGTFLNSPPTVYSTTHLSNLEQDLAVPHVKTKTRNRSITLSPQLPLSPRLTRALSIAAAGCHHVLILGSCGRGKTSVVEWSLQLPLSFPEQLQVEGRLVRETAVCSDQSPTRNLSSQVRPQDLIGRLRRTGELTLAHGGILFADELFSWNRRSRELLLDPLESGSVNFENDRRPANFLLRATGNLCPCGGSTNPKSPPEVRCSCSTAKKRIYRERIKGPLFDRIDMVITIDDREKREASRFVETKRFDQPPGIMKPVQCERLLRENPEWDGLIQSRIGDNLRIRHKILKLSMSIAKWEGRENPLRHHFMEAIALKGL